MAGWSQSRPLKLTRMTLKQCPAFVRGIVFSAPGINHGGNGMFQEKNRECCHRLPISRT